jgi:acetyltransferase-like isoleucine patch superfamily enzyme
VIIGHLRDSTTQALIEDQPTVRIEDDVYIGPGVIVLPNVTIGEGALIGGGSVVTRDIPSRMVAYGNPARPVRPVTELTCLVDPPFTDHLINSRKRHE